MIILLNFLLATVQLRLKGSWNYQHIVLHIDRNNLDIGFYLFCMSLDHCYLNSSTVKIKI